MTKVITMKFTATIKDEDIPNMLSDEAVKEELIYEYNSWLRTDEMSDVEVTIETIE